MQTSLGKTLFFKGSILHFCNRGVQGHDYIDWEENLLKQTIGKMKGKVEEQLQQHFKS